jgi:Mg-chelatase subunit ChlD
MFRAILFSLAALMLLAALPPAETAAAPVPVVKKPKVEVVFCLDTTGSMGGLIDGAKAKIWAICNQIANGTPIPELKVGLVAYRDKRDEYTTQITEMTDDLDAIDAKLKTFTANGGGDFPEHVNQALDDAVNKVKWSTDKKTLKIIFLVGDAPPHMDYKDDVKYPETCKKAVEKGIIINTIQCGGNEETTKAWKDIATKSEGSFVAIPQNGGVVVRNTPFDPFLAALNTEVGKTVLVWGDAKDQADGLAKNNALRELSASAGAERVAYQAKNAQAATYCLLDSMKRGRVKLEDLKPEQLPENMRKMDAKQQKAYLSELDEKREKINKQVIELDKMRSAWIAKKQAAEAKKGTAGFDGQVLEIMRNQAKKFEIVY